MTIFHAKNNVDDDDKLSCNTEFNTAMRILLERNTTISLLHDENGDCKIMENKIKTRTRKIFSLLLGGELTRALNHWKNHFSSRSVHKKKG